MKTKKPRDLTRIVLALVALAAAAGWAASFVGLRGFGLTSMVGYDNRTSWLIPGAFDGAAIANAVLTYRASIKGRAAVRARLLTWAFTALSSWINFIHQADGRAQLVAVWLPIAAVAVFDVVLGELRADYEERHGRKAFRMRLGLLGLRYATDKTGTKNAFRKQITDIPVSNLVGLGADLMVPAGKSEPEPVAVPEQPKREPAPELPAPRKSQDVAAPVEPEPVTELVTEPESTPDNVVPFASERPEWLTKDMTAKQAMFAYLDLHPHAKGSELDRFGMQHLGTKKDYGRGVRREWVARQSADQAVNGE